MPPRIHVALALLLLSLTPARTHEYWLETTLDTVRICFGAYEQNLRATGDLLGRRLTATSWVERIDGRTQALRPELKDDHLAAPLPPAVAWVLLTDATLPVKDLTAQGYGVCRIWMYSRAPVRPGEKRVPRLTLDLLPAPEVGVVTAWFRGQPLAGAQVSLVSPSGESVQRVTDAEGRLTLPTPRPLLVDLLHREAVRGEYGGQTFEATLHRTTLLLPAPR